MNNPIKKPDPANLGPPGNKHRRIYKNSDLDSYLHMRCLESDKKRWKAIAEYNGVPLSRYINGVLNHVTREYEDMLRVMGHKKDKKTR